MKTKILSILISGCITISGLSSFVPTELTSFAITQEFEYPTEIISSDYYTQEVDYSLWDKFIKYDLCITDYDSLTNEEKELCKFIFETERSADGTVICERARRTLADDENIGERITLEQLENAYGIWDNYSPTKIGNSWYLHCVPDIKYLDGWDDYNEYWIDDEGTVRIRFTGENSGSKNGIFYIYEGNNSYQINAKQPLAIKTDEYFVVPENYIEYNGDYYYIKDDNTASLIKSNYDQTNLDFEEIPIEGKIVIPDEINGYPVTEIEQWAFLGSSATEIILPDTIEYINTSAFEGCIYLQKVNIPDNLKYIGEQAFGYCDSLKELNINAPHLVISPYAFYNCRQLTDLTLNVKSIDNKAFLNCVNLKNLNLKDSIEKIGANSFFNCLSLENIVLPSSLNIIGCGAFSNNYETENHIKSITIPSNVEIIGALPRARGEGATSGIYVPATDPLTEEPVCAFDSDCIIYGYKGTETESYANEWNLTFIALDSSEIMTGDANQDSEVTISDVVAISAFISNAEKYPLSLDVQTACDVQDTGNGLNSSDAFKIQQYVTGVIESL